MVNCLNQLALERYSVYNTKGIKGDFYTTDRKNDLLTAAKEVLEEKTAEIKVGSAKFNRLNERRYDLIQKMPDLTHKERLELEELQERVVKLTKENTMRKYNSESVGSNSKRFWL